jgi:hypothetical protein
VNREIVTTSDYRADIARLNALTEAALAQYEREGPKRYKDHVNHVLNALDCLITRTREIDQLRRDSHKQPRNLSELIDALEQRLAQLRALNN